ncbi:MAG: AcrB/AcrD/AcrF family protein, partial [Sphingomonadales bacterium]
MAGEDITDTFARHWRRWLLLVWAVAAVYLLHDRWGMIQGFFLPDTDDNMRIMQVRGLLKGQGWFDLRQYRLDPPYGANIHWSRLVDLPIAGIILALRPFMSGALAEKVAVAVAPMLPMLVAMAGTGLAARRIIAPKAAILAMALLVLCAHSARLMWAPMRIDHHGWQLAFLSLVVAGMTDPKRVRGGLTVGLASAASLTIGLEMLPYLALTGAIHGLRWIRDREAGP